MPKVYCLEAVSDGDVSTQSSIMYSLAQLALHGGVANVYATCDGIDTFLEAMDQLIYLDRQYNDYSLLYFVVEGEESEIELDGYVYPLRELADLFEGKLSGKRVHFANTKTLRLDVETSQYFIEITGAKSLSGYTREIPIHSAPLDCQFFALACSCEDTRELTEVLFEKHYTQCTTLGFEMYY